MNYMPFSGWPPVGGMVLKKSVPAAARAGRDDAKMGVIR